MDNTLLSGRSHFSGSVHVGTRSFGRNVNQLLIQGVNCHRLLARPLLRFDRCPVSFPAETHRKLLATWTSCPPQCGHAVGCMVGVRNVPCLLSFGWCSQQPGMIRSGLYLVQKVLTPCFSSCVLQRLMGSLLSCWGGEENDAAEEGAQSSWECPAHTVVRERPHSPTGDVRLTDTAGQGTLHDSFPENLSDGSRCNPGSSSQPFSAQCRRCLRGKAPSVEPPSLPCPCPGGAPSFPRWDSSQLAHSVSVLGLLGSSSCGEKPS